LPFRAGCLWWLQTWAGPAPRARIGGWVATALHLLPCRDSFGVARGAGLSAGRLLWRTPGPVSEPAPPRMAGIVRTSSRRSDWRCSRWQMQGPPPPRPDRSASGPQMQHVCTGPIQGGAGNQRDPLATPCWTDEVCTVECSQVVSIASGKPVSPSQQTISTSLMPRLASSTHTPAHTLRPRWSAPKSPKPA
jgi:hypothetical protein